MLVKLGNWFEIEVAMTAFFMSIVGYAVFVKRSLAPLMRLDLYRTEGEGVYLEVIGLMFVFSKESA
jgi:hypothetical protein